MSVTFTKLFSSITASTIWCESSDTRVVWITMLAMSDRYGRVWASIPGLAKEAAVSVEACRAAVHAFLSPDPDSRTKVAEGRRIEPIDGGWKLINHAKYRAIRDEEERRAYKTEKQRQYRSVDNSVDNVDTSGTKLNDVDPGAHNADTDTDTEQKQKTPRRVEVVSFKVPEWVPLESWNDWIEVRKRKRAANTIHALELAVRELDKLRQQGHSPIAVLEQSTLKSYTGLFPVNGSHANGKQRPLEGMKFANAGQQ